MATTFIDIQTRALRTIDRVGDPASINLVKSIINEVINDIINRKQTWRFLYKEMGYYVTASREYIAMSEMASDIKKVLLIKDSDGVVLEQLDKLQFNQFFARVGTGSIGDVTCWMQAENYIYFGLIPESDELFYIKYEKTIPSLANDADEPSMPENMRYVIIDGTVAKLADYMGEPATRCDRLYAIYERGIKHIKTDDEDIVGQRGRIFPQEALYGTVGY